MDQLGGAHWLRLTFVKRKNKNIESSKWGYKLNDFTLIKMESSRWGYQLTKFPLKWLNELSYWLVKTSWSEWWRILYLSE
jgi:hypothetical protein